MLNDAHPTVIGQDPTHDWIDGRAFATGILGGAAFDDATARRWENWHYDAGTKGVGQLRDMTLAAEWADSIPAAALVQSRPLYHLFLETAGRADDFDSRDVNGQADTGARRNNGGSYANWTQAELNEVADVVAPRAMRATAELLRYFYALVDTTPAAVTIPGLSANEAEPTLISGSAMLAVATGTDATSGVDLVGYRFTLDVRGCCGWTPEAASGPDLPEAGFTGLAPGLYRVRASVENGAGATTDSPYAYFEMFTPVDVAVDGAAGGSGLVAVRTGDDGHSVVITYRIAGAPHPVQLDVHNVSGERVRQLGRVPHDPGTYVRTWDGADDSGARVARGVYFVRWAAGRAHYSRKVVLRID